MACAGIVLACLAGPGSGWASGFTITRQVTSLEVRRTGHYTETVERTLRIDSPAGVDEHDQWSLTFNPERTKLEVLEAWTQTPSGQRIAVPKSRIVVRERTERDLNNLFTGRRSMVVVHPRVEVGSLLHIHWRATHAPVYPGRFAWRDALDPADPPEEWTLRLAYEPGMPMRTHHPGLVGRPLAPDEKGWLRHEFGVDKEEISRSEARRRASPEGPWLLLALSTYASWAEVARAYREGAQPQAAVTPPILAHAREVTKEARFARERVRLLHDWVRRNVRYAGVQGARTGHQPFPAEEVLGNRYGDCKDKSNLLQALLAAVGIHAQAVLINDGFRVELPVLPTPFFFNHVMVHIPSMGLYLDPTAAPLPLGVHHREHMGQPVLHVGTGQTSRTPGPSPTRDATEVDIAMEMRPDGSVYGSSRSVLTGHVQVKWRYEFGEGFDGDDAGRQLLADRGDSGTGVVEVFSDEHEPVMDVRARFDIDPLVDLGSGRKAASLLRLPQGAAPGGLSRLAKGVGERPHACRSERHHEKLSLTLPAGHVIDGSLPEAVNFSQGALTYRSSYQARREGGRTTLTVTREYIANCATRKLSRGDWKDLEALKVVVARDLRAQVGVR